MTKALLLLLLLFIAASALAVPGGDHLQIDPWGPNTIRIRATAGGVGFNENVPSALQSNEPPASLSSTFGEPSPAPTTVKSGDLVAVVSAATGLITFTSQSTGKVLFSEVFRYTPAQSLVAKGLAAPCGVSFSAQPDELIFGLGQGMPFIPYPTYRIGPLNHKGDNISFASCVANEGGAANCLPWHTVVRNVGNGVRQVQYGLLWNVPAFGGVHFAPSQTDWWADGGWQIDYLVSVPPAGDEGAARFNDLHAQFTNLIGRTPPLPSSLLGYWHSKNAYRTQQDVLTVMAGFRARNIPVDVLIIDIGGSKGKLQGDWRFDPAQFPDPSAMTAELAKSNTRVMVSMWSGTGVGSLSFNTLVSNKWVASNDTVATFTPIPWPIGCSGPQCFLYDASNPAARAYVWSMLKAGFVAHNITLFWLDASEPQSPILGIGFNAQYLEAKFAAGKMTEVGMAFAKWHTGTFREGFERDGLNESVTLARSGWFGTSAHGSALWSGDTLSDFATLQHSVVTGLGAQITGIAWWTTDIGGYRCLNESDSPSTELIVRWFQFGMTCPIFRQHGNRPETAPWAYGPVAEGIIADLIRQRASMKGYYREQHDLLASTGLPFNRPLWWDFPEDPQVWQLNVTDSYMMGTDYLAAPILFNATYWRDVYLPAGWTWRHYFTNTTYKGGQTYNVSAPLQHFPLFHKETPLN